MSDNIPAEMLDQMVNLPLTSTYKVYFDKETGEIKSITTDTLPIDTFAEMEYANVSDFLSGAKSIFDYRVVVLSGVPSFIKNVYDLSSIILAEVPEIDEQDGIIIENFPTQRVWNFRISETKKSQVEKFNLNTVIDVYVVDVDNYNFLYRTIKVPLMNLIKDGRLVVNHDSAIERRVKRIKVLTNSSIMDLNIKVKNVKKNKSN